MDYLRFTSGYIDGLSLYNAYFAVNGIDPFGNIVTPGVVIRY